MALADYKVMVRILAVNGVSAVMRTIAKDVLGLGTNVDAVGSKFGRWKVAVLGMVGVVGVLDSALVRAGDKIVQQQRMLRASGVSASAVANATRVAEQVSLQVPGTTTAGNLHLQKELRAALGSMEGANQALPLIAKNVAALQMSGIPGFSNTISLFKALDLFGAGIKNGQFNPQEFAKTFQMLTQFEFFTSGLLPPNMMMRVAQLGGFVGQMGGDTKSFLIDMLSGFLQLGTRAGSGLAQVAEQLIGGQASIKAIYGLREYGLLGPHGFVNEKGHYAVKPGALKGYEDIIRPGGGIVYWIEHTLIPSLRAHGATTDAQLIAAIEQIFGNVRGQRLVAAYATTAGQLMYHRERSLAIEATHGQPYEQMSQAFSGALFILRGALSNFFQILGMPTVSPAVSVLNAISSAIVDMTSFAVKNPEIVRTLSGVILALSVALTTLGAVAVVGALVSLAGPGGLLFALAAGIATLGVAFGKWKPWVLGMILGAGGGAAIGMGIGSVVPGIGTVLGGAIGGVIGGAAGAFGSYETGLHFNAKKVLDQAAATQQLPQALLEHMSWIESGYNPAIVNSTTGATGLMQLMPGTAKGLGVTNIKDPLQNAMGGAKYLRQMYDRYHGNWAEAIAAYNWGPGNLDQDIAKYGIAWKLHLPQETKSYVDALMPYTVSSKNLPQVGAPAVQGGDPGPLHVIVDNGRDLADGVTAKQAQELQRNPAGPTGHNPARGFYPPGMSQPPILLP